MIINCYFPASLTVFTMLCFVQYILSDENFVSYSFFQRTEFMTSGTGLMIGHGTKFLHVQF